MKKIKNIILFLFLACITITNAFAQSDSLRMIWEDETKPDSTRFNAINAFYIKNTFTYPDSTSVLTKYHYALAQQKKSKDEMAKALNEKAFAAHILGEPDSSMALLKKALVLRSDIKDDIGVARINANIGSIYRGQSDYQKAVRYFTLSLGTFEENKRYLLMADVLNNLGLIYYDIGMYDFALDYLNQAMKLYEQENMKEKNGNIWLNIGAIYFLQGDLEKAKKYLHKAYKILEASNNLWSLADYHHQMALLYEDLGEADSAKYYVAKSLKITKELGNEDKVLADLIIQGNLMIPVDLNEAVKIGESILELSQKSLNKEIKANIYKLLYECYKKQNRYKLAMESQERYLLYYDSCLIDENKVTIVREAIQSDYDFKLFNTQFENKQKQAQLKLNQLKKIYTIVLLGVVLILTILFYTRFRIKTHRLQRDVLLQEIENLKENGNEHLDFQSNNSYQLDKRKLELTIDRKLNETDWKVLQILLDDPVITNKEIAEKAFMSIDGIGSSLKRMYGYFDIKESKYKKISLLLDVIKISNRRK